MVRPWYEVAKATFPTLVDTENLLGDLYHLKAIPYALLINEQGELVEGPVSANIGNEEFRARLERWITDPAYEAEMMAEGRAASKSETSPELREAALRFQLGRLLLEQGRQAEAMQEWRQALALDPDNWIIHKQIWAVEHPDRFYEGSVDYDWQKRQLEAERAQ